MRVRPSEDIGRLANDHLKRGRLRGDPILAKRLFNVLDLGVDGEADLASYLLFDGPFCRRLIEMGRADAQARRDELVHFFRDALDRGGGDGRGRCPTRRAASTATRCTSGRDARAPRQSAELVHGARALAHDLAAATAVRSITVVGTEPPAPAVEHERQPPERRVDLVRDPRGAPRPAAPRWSR